MSIAIILGAIAILLLSIPLVGAAMLKLACRLVDRDVTPSYGKAIVIVLVAGAAGAVMTPLLGGLPGATTLGELGVKGLPDLVLQVKLNIFGPLVMLLIEGALLRTMLPTSFGRGLAISLMRSVLAWAIIIGLAFAAIAVLSVLLDDPFSLRA